VVLYEMQALGCLMGCVLSDNFEFVAAKANSGANQMRAIFGTICLLIAATPAMANVPVPAPLLGGGIAAMAAVGGVLLASRLFKRN
jgi:hypothetical protein